MPQDDNRDLARSVNDLVRVIKTLNLRIAEVNKTVAKNNTVLIELEMLEQKKWERENQWIIS